MDILWILWCNCKFRSMDFTFFPQCYPASTIIISGDFNQFRHSQPCNSSSLKQVVRRHETRGSNILDKIFTNVSRFITPPRSFHLLVSLIDILYTLDSASNYSAIQKLKPWLQAQDIPMKWEDSNVFYFLNRELNH